jgi:hypothetical protein
MFSEINGDGLSKAMIFPTTTNIHRGCGVIPPLFVFIPKIIQRAMKTDTDAVLEAFGKNEQVKKVFWALFAAMAGLMAAQVLDPVTAHQVVGIITGIGV